MFIELLIVFGIIGILGTIIIIAINPTKHLCETTNAKRHINMREIGNAANEYQIRTRQTILVSMPVGEANAIPICTVGVSTDSTCANFDVLLPDYIGDIPRDSLETNPNYTGYSIYRLPGGLDLVRSDHIETCL
jgi:hypothetical protein